jgi:excisionase family DNA binding protein
MAEMFLSLHDVGDELGVSVQTVRRWVKAGELAAYKPGKEYRIKPSDLEEFLKTREVRPKGRAPLPLDVGNGGSGAFGRGSVGVWVRYLEESVGYFARRLERQDLGLSGISEISSLTIGLIELRHIFDEDVRAEADADLLNRYEKAVGFLVFDLDDMVIERYDREVGAAKETPIGGDALDETAAISFIEEWKSKRLKGREKLRLGA